VSVDRSRGHGGGGEGRSIHHRAACRLAPRAKPSSSRKLGTLGDVGRAEDLRLWPTAAATATRADRGGRRRAATPRAPRSQTPTNGAELRNQSLKTGASLMWPIRSPRDCQRGPLLTVCSQTVRILLDVTAHVRGKHAGQAHNGGHACTSWDRLAGFKSRHPDQHGAPGPGAPPRSARARSSAGLLILVGLLGLASGRRRGGSCSLLVHTDIRRTASSSVLTRRCNWRIV
jgi:hypothetical protein